MGSVRGEAGRPGISQAPLHRSVTGAGAPAPRTGWRFGENPPALLYLLQQGNLGGWGNNTFFVQTNQTRLGLWGHPAASECCPQPGPGSGRRCTKGSRAHSCVHAQAGRSWEPRSRRGWGGAPSTPRRSRPQPRSEGGVGTNPADRHPETLWGGRAEHRHAGLLGVSLPGEHAPLSVPRPGGEGGGGPAGPHQAELTNFVVGHKAEDVLDGYDGQRHQRVVLRQLVLSQRWGWGRLGPRLWGRGWGRWGQSLGRADGRRGTAVAVAAASFFSHPLLRRRRHLGGLIPSPHCKGIRDTSGASLPPLEPLGRGLLDEWAEPMSDPVRERAQVSFQVAMKEGL